MKTIRTAVLAATAALLVMPAVQAGGLGGALGGTVGGALGGGFGASSIGGTGGVAGNGEGRFGTPELGRPMGRLPASAKKAASDESTTSAPAPTSEAPKGLSTDGLIGVSAGAKTPKHEASVDGAGAASAHAGRKAPPAAAPSSDSTAQ